MARRNPVSFTLICSGVILDGQMPGALPESTVPTATVARFVLLTPHRIRQLVNERVLERAKDRKGQTLRGRFYLRPTVNRYITYLRDKVARNGAEESGYRRARAARMEAQAQIEQLRLQRIKGKLHHANDIEFCVTSMITRARSRLLSVPSRLMRSLVGLTDPREIHQLVEAEIYLALNELAEYKGPGQAETDAYLERVIREEMRDGSEPPNDSRAVEVQE